jgi:hypothetical protein
MRALKRAIHGTEHAAPALLASLLPAIAIFWIAFDGGSYSLPSRNTLAIALWWAVTVGLVFGLLPARNVTRSSIAIGGLLAALSLWTLTSILWAPSAENAFDEFNRVALFLGVFVLVALVARREMVGRLCDGLAIAITTIALIALVSRLFPGVFSDRGVAASLPSAATRLSFPLDYWNGLAVFVALGVPLVLRAAMTGRSAIARGLALAPLPMIASVIFLASSRSGIATALVGVIVFFALSERRWSAAGALVVTALGSAAAVAILAARSELVNGPLGTDLGERQGREAALLIALTCITSAAIFGLGSWFLRGRFKASPRLGRTLVLGSVLAIGVGIYASHPIARFQAFKRSPAEATTIRPGDFMQAHLLSGSGSGRWQFWSAATEQWEHSKLLGSGAGSYEAWWAEHGSFTYSVNDAHSLYLEALGELGLVGLLFTGALVVGGVSVGIRRSCRSSGDARVTTAALTGVFAAYAVAAGIDWMWEVTAVSVVAFAALALLSGSVGTPSRDLRVAGSDESRRSLGGGRLGFGIATLVVIWLVICAQTIPLLAQLRIKDSRAAISRGDAKSAANAALDARNIQPWAASPYFQLALVSEQRGELRRAREWIERAIKHDERNWKLWLVSARLDTKLGDTVGATDSLRRAVELNPRSPLFSGLELGWTRVDEN